MVHGVHRTCAETAAVLRGTSHVTTKQHCQYTTSVDMEKTRCKKIQSRIQNYTRHEHTERALPESIYRTALYKLKAINCNYVRFVPNMSARHVRTLSPTSTYRPISITTSLKRFLCFWSDYGSVLQVSRSINKHITSPDPLIHSYSLHRLH